MGRYLSPSSGGRLPLSCQEPFTIAITLVDDNSVLRGRYLSTMCVAIGISKWKDSIDIMVEAENRHNEMKAYYCSWKLRKMTEFWVNCFTKFSVEKITRGSDCLAPFKILFNHLRDCLFTGNQCRNFLRGTITLTFAYVISLLWCSCLFANSQEVL